MRNWMYKHKLGRLRHNAWWEEILLIEIRCCIWHGWPVIHMTTHKATLELNRYLSGKITCCYIVNLKPESTDSVIMLTPPVVRFRITLEAIMGTVPHTGLVTVHFYSVCCCVIRTFLKFMLMKMMFCLRFAIPLLVPISRWRCCIPNCTLE